ncbi:MULTISPECIES: signal peptidase II [Kocuria]|jgi:signal peptidase II|uniref:Lipoprotein signal peptidase n=2 Tax=Kocuria TaxID=57493 RepID=A0A2N4T0Y6_9MICC|nr:MULTISPECIES: signal peptidase II [Kocuria]KLU08398.1 lipoprotein signal peptidase [Kocuria sp. SM24M-10]PLC11895.1 lipoprotein signal peptidase [Kocuria flava]WJZ68506.1 signal peptidase II [Kocuria rosea]
MSDAPPPRTGASSRPETRRRTVVLLVGAAGLAAVDLIVKAVAEARLASGEAVDLGLLMLRLHHNPGVAFSLGAALPSWVVIAATGAIIAGLTWYLLIAVPTLTRLTRVGATLLLGGAIGNFLDRLDGDGVVDYLHTGWFPTFNLADVFVTTGVVALLVGTMVPPRTEDHA